MEDTYGGYFCYLGSLDKFGRFCRHPGGEDCLKVLPIVLIGVQPYTSSWDHTVSGGIV